jgi:integrase
VYYPISETKSRRRGVGNKSKVKIVILNKKAQETVGRQKSRDDFVFPLRKRDANAVKKVVPKLRKLSGVEDFSFHLLRHTASTIVSSQSSLATARAVLGHADIRTTLQYTHPEIEEQRESVAKLGEYLSGLIP